ncbi:MAG: 3-hydroxyisobutyrate dehydrogenase [Legionellaceae bacterium]|nr:3-hydroxyisobutyrate dehydrogenase [Legionellaceae bacterium]
MAKIGFVGLGHMGLPMAINLIQAGHEVTGFDLQKKAVRSLMEKGGREAKSIRELATKKDVLITMLQTGDQVASVCMGEDGLLLNASASTLYIDCSTIDVESSRNIHHQADILDIPVVDAPVSGGVAGATSAALTFMVGGVLTAFNLAQPILNAMGSKVIHTGGQGSGQAAKICNNMILGISMIAASEAFKLGEALGLTAEKLHEVVSNASGQSWVMDKYVPVPNVLEGVPANNNYEPGFTAAMMLKDLNLSQKSAASIDIKTELASLATRIYQQAIDNGRAEKDFSAIIEEDFL